MTLRQRNEKTYSPLDSSPLASGDIVSLIARGTSVVVRPFLLTWSAALMRVPQYLRLGLKIACTGGLLWLIFSQLDLKEAVDQILVVGRVQLVGALIILFSLSLPSTIRWGNVLKIVGYPLKFSTAWTLMLVSGFFTQALPSSLGGDIVRMTQVFRIGMPTDIAISNVVIDRLTSFASLLLLVVMTLPNLFFLIGDTLPWWMTPIFVVAGVMTLYLLTLFKHFPEQPRNSQFVVGVINFSKHLSAILSNRWWGWGAILAGLSVHIMRVVAIWIMAKGLHIDAGLLDCLVLVPLALLVAMIPISIGGWGIREGAFLGAFSLVGVSSGDAVALSVTFGLSRTFISLPGGLIWLFNRDIRESVNADWIRDKEERT